MIVDTSALIAVLFGEPEADSYTRLIHIADRCLISAGTFLELSIVIERQTGPEVARQCDMFSAGRASSSSLSPSSRRTLRAKPSTISEKGVILRG
jgi:uncharacterized protein with PIN domain